MPTGNTLLDPEEENRSLSNDAQPQPSFRVTPNVALLWLGQLISILGDWCLWVAIPFTVYNRTNSKADLAFTVVTEGLPMLLFSPIAGVIVDRSDRRKVMIAADLARALLVGLLALPIFKVTPLWEFYAVLFCASACSAFFGPARVVVTTQIVPQRQLLRVNALLSTSLQISETVGPAVAGFIVFKLLLRGAFVADAISFVASAVCIAFLRFNAEPVKSHGKLSIATIRQGLRAGAQFIWQTPVLRGLLIAWNTGFFASAIFVALLYAFARDVLHLQIAHFGLLLSCLGVGFLIGGVLVGVALHRSNPTTLMLLGLVLSAVAAVWFSVATVTLTACAALVTFGFAGLLVNIPAQTLVQTVVERDKLGQFSAAFSVIARSAQVLGAACAALLASEMSLQATYRVVALAFAFSAVLALIYLRERGELAVPILSGSPHE